LAQAFPVCANACHTLVSATSFISFDRPDLLMSY
jgi:hypothetical protein